jgi:hypothetical protein
MIFWYCADRKPIEVNEVTKLININCLQKLAFFTTMKQVRGTGFSDIFDRLANATGSERWR